MAPHTPTRRGILKSLGALGCSAAAWPLTTAVTFAAAPGDARLVVIVLRGGMDGLDVLRPVGDSAFAALRPTLATGEALPLGDGFFALHPALAPLLPLWQAGELGFAHAVATPYRDKRSHFDGQDVLEAGTVPGAPGEAFRDGWLNRMIQAVPGMRGESAYAIGRENMKILAGAAEVSSWAPEIRFRLTPQAELLLERLYREHPLFMSAQNRAVRLMAELEAEGGFGAPEEEAMGMGGGGRPGPRGDAALAAFAAGRLNGEARIAAFSLSGWDTHRNQATALPGALTRLAEVITTLRQRLGENWSRTAVLAMTEFGRTVRENGTRGTDHGTGGLMLFAGGALRGGQVHGRWPGLDEASLYDRRDLLPTHDVRAYAAWALRGLFGLERAVLEDDVFPLLDMGDDPKITL
jgi:uncharacterized protein (DUF1501 family)